MSAITLPAANVSFFSLQEYLPAVYSTLSELSPENLKLLIKFFQLQASKYSKMIETTSAVASGLLMGAVTLSASAIGIQNRQNQVGLIGCAALCAFASFCAGFGLLVQTGMKNGQTMWANRCIELLELKTGGTV